MAARIFRAAAAASGDAMTCRVEATMAYTMLGRISAYSPAVGGIPAICA